MIQTVLEIVSQQKRLVAAVAALFCINSGLYVFDAAYLSPAVSSAMSNWNDLRRQSHLAAKTDINAAYRQGMQDLEALKSRLQYPKQFPRVLEKILGQASLSKVTLGKISYKPADGKEQKLPAYKISMSASGGYLELKCFLAELLDSDELLVVDNIKLTSGAQPEENITMDISLTVYFRKTA